MSVIKITSKRVQLPDIWLIEDEADFLELSGGNSICGLPFIVGKAEELDFIRIYLEFQVLMKSCKNTGLSSINWLKCLKRLGYKNLRKYTLSSGGEYYAADSNSAAEITIDQFVEDQYVVNFDELSKLKILPSWMEDLKTAIETNIIDEVTFNAMGFNKQLGMNVGCAEVKNNPRNLLILDISGSIPDGVRLTTIQLSKLMSKKFYADVIFTGGSTKFVSYENMMTIDVKKLTDGISRSNEGEQYNAIVKEHKVYQTAICFGDNDSPSGTVSNFKIDTLISLHTEAKTGGRVQEVVGYGKYLKATNTRKILDWVASLN
tara:strand:+ start:1495 stop:2448 length:954 start_codon:yes stop_codon:yes gene_type:complete